MGFIGIGAVLALLFTLITFRARIRHARAVRLIHQTPVTPIASLVRSCTGQSDPFGATYAAVQGCVVAREATRLTAPITGSSCVAYKVRVYKASDDDETPDENYIEDSKWVPWAVEDGTGLALAPFNPFEPPKALNRDRYCYWPGTESTGDTFKDTPQQLDRVISHYGRGWLPSRDLPYYIEKRPVRLDIQRSPPDTYDEDLSWEVSILKEFGNEVFLLGPCTVQEAFAHFQLGSDSLLWFGSRADALSHEQLAARSSARWAKIWFTVSVILAAAYLHFG